MPPFLLCSPKPDFGGHNIGREGACRKERRQVQFGTEFARCNIEEYDYYGRTYLCLFLALIG
jgi:hypothetical protein